MGALEKEIVNIIGKYSKNNVENLCLESKLESDLGYTSLAFVCLVMELETHFDFQFEDDYLDINRLVSVTDVIQYVKMMVSKDESV